MSSDFASRLEQIPRESPNDLLASAFGFRDQDFLKLRLYALHEAKFKLVGEDRTLEMKPKKWLKLTSA
jgi:hypothetical protein